MNKVLLKWFVSKPRCIPEKLQNKASVNFLYLLFISYLRKGHCVQLILYMKNK